MFSRRPKPTGTVRRPIGPPQSAPLEPLEEISRQLARIALALEVANTLAAQGRE